VTNDIIRRREFQVPIQPSRARRDCPKTSEIIANLKADKSVPEAQKKEDLAQLEAALKDEKPILRGITAG
jgi:hypothetical protein